MRRKENKVEAERRGQPLKRRGMEERREGRKESEFGEHRRWWKKRGAAAHGVGKEESGGREDEEEGPLLQPSLELRNPHRLGLAAGCARRSAPAPREQWEQRGVAFMGVESRRALWLCSHRGPLSEDLSLQFRAASLLLTLGARSTLAADQGRVH